MARKKNTSVARKTAVAVKDFTLEKGAWLVGGIGLTLLEQANYFYGSIITGLAVLLLVVGLLRKRYG